MWCDVCWTSESGSGSVVAVSNSSHRQNAVYVNQTDYIHTTYVHRMYLLCAFAFYNSMRARDDFQMRQNSFTTNSTIFFFSLPLFLHHVYDDRHRFIALLVALTECVCLCRLHYAVAFSFCVCYNCYVVLVCEIRILKIDWIDGSGAF